MKKKHSDQCKQKITQAMRDKLSPPTITNWLKRTIINNYIMIFLQNKTNEIESNLKNNQITYNCHWEPIDEDIWFSTKDISIFEFQERLTSIGVDRWYNKE